MFEEEYCKPPLNLVLNYTQWWLCIILSYPSYIWYIGIGSWHGPYDVRWWPLSPSILKSTYWYWVLAWEIWCLMMTTITIHTKLGILVLVTTIHTKIVVLVLGLVTWAIWCSMMTTITIHTEIGILVLGLGMSHMLFDDDNHYHPY